MPDHSTVTLLARLRGLWLRPALRALTSLREISLRRKPLNLAPVARPLILAKKVRDNSTSQAGMVPNARPPRKMRDTAPLQP